MTETETGIILEVLIKKRNHLLYQIKEFGKILSEKETKLKELNIRIAQLVKEH